MMIRAPGLATLHIIVIVESEKSGDRAAHKRSALRKLGS